MCVPQGEHQRAFPEKKLPRVTIATARVQLSYIPPLPRILLSRSCVPLFIGPTIVTNMLSVCTIIILSVFVQQMYRQKKNSTCVQITITPSGLRGSDLGCVKSAPTFAACSSPPWGLLPSAACLTSLIAFVLRRPPVSHACFIGCSPCGALFDTSLIFGAPRVWFRLFLTSSHGCLLAAHPFLRPQHKSNCALVPDYKPSSSKVLLVLVQHLTMAA